LYFNDGERLYSPENREKYYDVRRSLNGVFVSVVKSWCASVDRALYVEQPGKGFFEYYPPGLPLDSYIVGRDARFFIIGLDPFDENGKMKKEFLPEMGKVEGMSFVSKGRLVALRPLKNRSHLNLNWSMDAQNAGLSPPSSSFSLSAEELEDLNSLLNEWCLLRKEMVSGGRKWENPSFLIEKMESLENNLQTRFSKKILEGILAKLAQGDVPSTTVF